jgi:PKD repeat protein
LRVEINKVRTQTWAPADLNIGAISTQTVTLVWTPIEFRQGDGGYAIEVAEQAAGPFQQVTETASKADSSFQVSGLKPDTNYFFRVRTHTTPYDRQQNDLWSRYSPLISVRTYTPVVAAFTASDQIGVAPMEVSLDNASSGNPYQVSWDFGDGITSTLNSPQHVYAAAGEYTVTLTVSGDGEVDSLVSPALIQVYDGLEINLPTDEPIYMTYVTGGVTVTLSSQAQTMNEAMKVMFLPDEPPARTPPGYQSLGFGFWLAAIRANQWLESYDFPQPFMVNIDGLPYQEEPLLMEYRENAWIEELCPASNSIQVVGVYQLCHSGQFALFERTPVPPSQTAQLNFFPFIMR